MWQIVLTIIFYVWLFLVLLLLWLIWISNRRLQSTLISAALTSAGAAQQSADAAQRTAKLLEQERHAD